MFPQVSDVTRMGRTRPVQNGTVTSSALDLTRGYLLGSLSQSCSFSSASDIVFRFSPFVSTKAML